MALQCKHKYMYLYMFQIFEKSLDNFVTYLYFVLKCVGVGEEKGVTWLYVYLYAHFLGKFKFDNPTPLPSFNSKFYSGAPVL